MHKQISIEFLSYKIAIDIYTIQFLEFDLPRTFCPGVNYENLTTISRASGLIKYFQQDFVIVIVDPEITEITPYGGPDSRIMKLM